MRPPVTRTRLLESVVRWSCRHAGKVLLAWGGVSIASALLLGHLEVDTTTDSVLDRSGTEWAAYQQSVALFGGDEVVVVALQAPEPFSSSTLGDVIDLSAAIEELPGVKRVDSLSTVPLIRLDKRGAIDLSPAISTDTIEVPGFAGRLLQDLSRDRVARRTLVSEDGSVFAVNVWLDAGGPISLPETLDNMRRLSVQAGASAVSGVPVFREAVNAATRREVVFFVPVTVVLMALVMFTAFRSAMAVCIPVATGCLGTLACLGAMVALGRPLTFSTMILPTVLIALGAAYTMHFVTATATATREGQLEERLARVAGPVALSALTTVVGFLAISVIRIDAVQELGAFGALGVGVILAATLTLAPAALAAGRRRRVSGRVAQTMSGALGGALFSKLMQQRCRLVAAWAFFTVVCAAGLPRVVVDNDVIRWFPTDSEVRQSYEFIREHLSGISPMNVVVEATNGGPLTEPTHFAAISALADFLEELPTVGKALSFTDPVQQMHEVVGGGENVGLPPTRDLVEQYLLLLESVELLETVLSPSMNSASVALRVDQNGSSELLAVAESARRWWQEQGDVGAKIVPTGVMYEFARAGDEIARGQLRGLVLALAAIAAVLLGTLRDARVAAVAVIPNALPLVAVFGVMGWTGIPIDAGTVSVGALALGIAVDDTIHLGVAYQRRRSAGGESRSSMREAMADVGPALVLTTVVICVGFAVLGLSEFTLVRNLGLITCVMIFLCLVADLTLLPALLCSWGNDRSGDE